MGSHANGDTDLEGTSGCLRALLDPAVASTPHRARRASAAAARPFTRRPHCRGAAAPHLQCCTGIEPADELSALEDNLKDKTFTFGSKGSTSGRLMPEFYIRDVFGAQPDDFFSRVGFSGNHTRTLRLVEAGTYQVGALNFQVWEKELADGNIDTDAVQVIWETPPYPDYQWTIRGDVNERFGDGFKERVTEALLNLDDQALLESFPRSGFIPASNDDYEPIRKTAEEIGILD